MHSDITCVILAGGLARRMGNIDKALVQLNGRSLLDHVIGRMAPQTDKVIINANGDPDRFGRWNYPVVPDSIGEFPGPLAGILAAMEWVKSNNPHAKWIVSVPVDTPFVPLDLVSTFSKSVQIHNGDLACASTNGRNHPVIGLWPVALAENLHLAMTEEKIRKVDLWTGRFKLAETEFSTVPFDPFFNINRPEDVEKAEEILQEFG